MGVDYSRQMSNTILFVVPNHALGHTVEAINIALRLQNRFHVVFLAENRSNQLISKYNFDTVSLPGRDFFRSSSGYFFDGYLEDCVEALVLAIAPHAIISFHPCFTFSLPDLCRVLEIPHIGVYGQFGRGTITYLSQNCNLVISTVPEQYAPWDFSNVFNVGPLLTDSTLTPVDISSSLVEEPFVLVSLGGGGYEQETGVMFKAIDSIARLYPSINFLFSGSNTFTKDAAPNFISLGIVQPHEMAYLQENCLVGIIRGGKTIFEMAARKKPLIALPLPGKKEQIHRSLMLTQAGGAEMLYFEEVNPATLSQKFGTILADQSRYISALDKLAIPNGLDHACGLIEELLSASLSKKYKTSEILPTHIYPFAGGVLYFTVQPGVTRVQAQYRTIDAFLPLAVLKQLSPQAIAQKFILPDWLLRHSPYSLRKLLGCKIEQRSDFQRNITICYIEFEQNKLNFGGVINENKFTSTFEVLPIGQELIKISLKLP